MNEKLEQNYWVLFDELSMFQAISLCLGYDPENNHSNFVESRRGYTAPMGYSALKNLIINAVKSERITAQISYHDYNQGDYVDIDETIVEVASFKKFLLDKRIESDFFFPNGELLQGYLNSNHCHFSVKLYAAISAWDALSVNPNLLNGKTPKQAIEKFLRDNAGQYELLKPDDTINETAIEEISKICNWKPQGGAAKTPTHLPLESNPPTLTKKTFKLTVYGEEQSAKVSEIDWDSDEIPF
jgi:hypothetical protein